MPANCRHRRLAFHSSDNLNRPTTATIRVQDGRRFYPHPLPVYPLFAPRYVFSVLAVCYSCRHKSVRTNRSGANRPPIGLQSKAGDRAEASVFDFLGVLVS